MFKNTSESQEEASKKLGIQRTQFGRILNGKLNPTLQQVCAIASHYNARVGWIVEAEGGVYKEKSGSLEKPDLHLITQLRKEIDVLRASLLRLSDLVPSVEEESSGQEVTFAHSEADKNQKAGKP